MTTLVDQIQSIREERDRLKERAALAEAAMQRERFAMDAEVQKWKDNHGLVLSDRDAWKARAEKAEAERDAMRTRLAPSLEYVEGVACGYGEDEIDRLTGVCWAVGTAGVDSPALDECNRIVEEARRG